MCDVCVYASLSCKASNILCLLKEIPWQFLEPPHVYSLYTPTHLFCSHSLLSVGVWELHSNTSPTYMEHHHPTEFRCANPNTVANTCSEWMQTRLSTSVFLTFPSAVGFFFSVSHNQCWQFNGKVKMRSHFSLTVVLVSRSDESWRSDEFTGAGSAPQKPRKTGSERGRITEGGGGLGCLTAWRHARISKRSQKILDNVGDDEYVLTNRKRK